MLKRILTLIMLVFIMQPYFAYAQEEYTTDIVYTIPWGDEPGQISSDFKTIGYIGPMEIFEPGPWAVSDSGVLVIFVNSQHGRSIMTFDQNGDLIQSRELALTYSTPRTITILDSGEIALSKREIPQKISLLDSNMNDLQEIYMPYTDRYSLITFTPTADSSFWLAFMVLEKIGNVEYQQYYKTEIFLDGTYSTPELTWDDVNNVGLPAKFIGPTGEPFLMTADKYGDLYASVFTDSSYTLYKWRLNPQGTEYDEVYTHTTLSDPGWEVFEVAQNTGPRHFVTWDGDFYTIHATDDGMVLTKHTYHPPSPPNQDPICVLDCPDLIVAESLPVPVVFDASGSYDPDGDPITYHWDFNGDGIFDGVGDEYTGDPWNPTHEFNQYGIHEVSLKVMDNKDGECVETVVIEIIES